MLTDTSMSKHKMSSTYIRLASGFSISGSSYSLIEQQTTIVTTAKVTMCLADTICTINTTGAVLVALGKLGEHL